MRKIEIYFDEGRRQWLMVTNGKFETFDHTYMDELPYKLESAIVYEMFRVRPEDHYEE
jgi:hypothetical protein